MSEGSTMRRWWLGSVGAALLLTAPLLGGCPAPESGGNTSNSAGKIEIAWTIRGITQEETFSASSGGLKDRYLYAATAGAGAVASVTADQTSRGYLACLITYVWNNDLYYTIDYAHDNNPGSVTCRADHKRILHAVATQKGIAPQGKVPPGCECKPDTLILNVTWLHR